MVLDGRSLQKYSVDAVITQDSVIHSFVSVTLSTFFLLYISEPLDYAMCNIAIPADDTTFYSRCDQASNLSQQLELASQLELTYETLQTGTGQCLLILMLKKLSLFV